MFFIKTSLSLSSLSIKLLKLFRLGQSTLRGQLYSEPYLGYPANERYPLNVSTSCPVWHNSFAILSLSLFHSKFSPFDCNHSAASSSSQLTPLTHAALLARLNRHLIQCEVNALPCAPPPVVLCAGQCTCNSASVSQLVDSWP